MRQTYYDSDGPPDVWQGIVNGGVRYTTNNSGNGNAWSYNGGTYQRTNYRFLTQGNLRYYQITYSIPSTSTGGSGGAGGVGAGYLQNVANGSNGSSGGTNSGDGGSGGNGGGFGESGSNGNVGANGNSTNGAAGAAGGAGGKYIRGLSFVTFTNNGTVAGGTA
jgi:hypothetical protein